MTNFKRSKNYHNVGPSIMTRNNKSNTSEGIKKMPISAPTYPSPKSLAGSRLILLAV